MSTAPQSEQSVHNGFLVILVAPNVSAQKGGEAMKALQIFRELASAHSAVVQITHERNREEIESSLNLTGVYYVLDSMVSRLLWKSFVFRLLVNVWFGWKAVRLAERLCHDLGYPNGSCIVHQTEPNSPVSPRFLARRACNVMGPINGNIYYPSAFRNRESTSAKFRRLAHRPFQYANRVFWRKTKQFDAIMVAGGERTIDSLKMAGATDDQLQTCLDYGIANSLLAKKRIEHRDENRSFVHFGRLVFHKGTELAIRAVAKSGAGATLDVIGRGPNLANCKRLVKELDVEDRVRFRDWFDSHDELLESLNRYRGFVLPSLEDANGIVVQEAMALGLPGVCLDWGGPQLLVSHGQDGFLVEARQPDYISSEIARCMDQLSLNAALAEKMSKNARAKAEQWRWGKFIEDQLSLYRSLLDTHRFSKAS